MSTAPLEVHRWSRPEYEQMVRQGLLGPEDRVELIDGIISDMSPQDSPHATGVTLCQEAVRPVCPPGSFLRVQMPLALTEDSMPEPDLAVVPGSPLDYSRSHPTTALLVIEVAGSSPHRDRGPKKDLYARVGIPEYWLLDLAAEALEVYRDPVQGRYRSREVLYAGDIVSPLFGPQAAIEVAGLFPLD